MAVAAVGQKPVIGLGEKAFKGVEFDLQLLAAKLVAIAADAHIAACLDGVVGLVILDAVSAHGGRPAPQLGVAVNHGFEVGTALQPVAKHKGRHFVAWPFGWLFGQHRRAF